MKPKGKIEAPYFMQLMDAEDLINFARRFGSEFSDKRVIELYKNYEEKCNAMVVFMMDNRVDNQFESFLKERNLSIVDIILKHSLFDVFDEFSKYGYPSLLAKWYLYLAHRYINEEKIQDYEKREV